MSDVSKKPLAETADKKPFKVLLTGGGTGGHLYPAVAVIEALLAAGFTKAQLAYIGHPQKREADVIPAMGVSFYGVPFSGLPKQRWQLPLWFLSALKAFVKAWPLLVAEDPNVVFATGGYVTVPVLCCAVLRGVPIVLHEPDAYAGKVNRLFSRFAKAVTCGFEGLTPQLAITPEKLHVTGNPLRKQNRESITGLDKTTAIAKLALPFAADRLTLLVVGGSQGAQRLNQAVLDALPELTGMLGLQIIHQVGESHYEAHMKSVEDKQLARDAYRVYPFIENMGWAYRAADLVLARAGAQSLSEIYAAGLPSILVPYPFAAADHQTHNAHASEAAGASIHIADAALTPEKLLTTLRDLVVTAEPRDKMAAAAKGLARPDAASDIAALLCQFDTAC